MLKAAVVRQPLFFIHPMCNIKQNPVSRLKECHGEGSLIYMTPIQRVHRECTTCKYGMYTFLPPFVKQ